MVQREKIEMKIILLKFYSITMLHENEGEHKLMKKDSWEHHRHYISAYMMLSSLVKNKSGRR